MRNKSYLQGGFSLVDIGADEGGGILIRHVGLGVHLTWILLTHNWSPRSSGPEPIGLFGME